MRRDSKITKQDSEQLADFRNLARGVLLPSRYFLAPINTGFCLNGTPTKGLLDFHSMRSGKGIGISYVGNVAIHENFVTSTSTPVMSRDQAWTKIAEGISRKGSVPGIQLACKLPGLLLAKKWINRDAIASATRWRERICGMSRDELGAIVSGFREAAEMALNHGFRVLQIHAAHGYFLSQMLSPTINKRDDFYGANRARILEEVIESIDCVRTDALIDVRISLASRLEDDYESELCLRATIESIYARNVDMISLSNGMYEVNRFDIYPRLKDGNACYLEPSIELSRQFPNILWNVAGNINDLADFARRATHNLSASIGRSLIADPEFVNRQVAGDGYQPCLRCGHCHYYSRGKLHLECGVNRLIQGSDAFDPL